MRIMGKFTPNTIFNDVSYFKVTIKHQCFLTLIIPREVQPAIFNFELDIIPPPPIIIRF